MALGRVCVDGRAEVEGAGTLRGPPVEGTGIVTALGAADFNCGPSETGTRRGPDPFVCVVVTEARGGTSDFGRVS